LDDNVFPVDDIDHTQYPLTTCTTHKLEKIVGDERTDLLTGYDALFTFMEDQGTCAMTAAPDD